MKKLVSFFLIFAISSFVYASFHVSFARIQQNDGLIKYFLDEAFTEEIDVTKYQTIDGNTKIYVAFSSSSKELTGISCARYDEKGQRVKSEELVCVSLDDGKGYSFELPGNTEFNEISIEPILSNKLVSINLVAFCDDAEVHDGKWFITTKGSNSLANGTVKLDSSSKYSVSFEIDSSKYYFASSEPENILAIGEITGDNNKTFLKVLFGLTDAGRNKEYVVNLKQYTSLVFDRNTLKKIISIERVGSGEELDVKNISSYKNKNGDSFVVTMDINSVLEAPGLIIDNSVYSGSVRKITITIPEENVSPILYVYSSERTGKSVGITWNVDAGVTTIPDIAISCGKDIREYRNGKKSDAIYILDGDVLFINVKKPSERVSVSVSVSGVEAEDITEVFSGSYLYDKVESISISVRKGYRFNESLIENGEHLKVRYFYENSTLKDGQFIPNGGKVSLVVECPYEYSAVNKHLNILDSDNNGITILRGTFTVSSETVVEDFKVSEKAEAGYFIDPDKYNGDTGTLKFFRANNTEITKRTFIKYSDLIRFKAEPAPGYIFNFINSEGKHDNKDEGNLPKDAISVTLFFDSIKFVSDEIKTVLLPQPDIGGMILYRDKNGNKITESYVEGKKGDVITAEFVAANHFKPAKTVDEYTIKEDSDFQNFPIANSFIEIEKPKMIIELLGYWNDHIMIEYSNSNSLSVSQIYPSKSEFGYDVSVEKDAISITSTSGFSRIYDYTLYISGYSLEDDEFVCASIIFPLSKENAVGDIYYSNKSSIKLVMGSLLSRQRLSNVEKVIIRLQKKKGFVFSQIKKIQCDVKVFRMNESRTKLKDGDYATSDEKLVLQVTPNQGFYITSDKDCKGYITQEILGKDLMDIIEKLEVKECLKIGLIKEDLYGTYSYFLNGNEINSDNLECRETDSLKVVFKVKEGISIKRLVSIFGNNLKEEKTFNNKDLINLNNRSIVFEDLGIEIK